MNQVEHLNLRFAHMLHRLLKKRGCECGTVSVSDDIRFLYVLRVYTKQCTFPSILGSAFRGIDRFGDTGVRSTLLLYIEQYIQFTNGLKYKIQNHTSVNLLFRCVPIFSSDGVRFLYVLCVHETM
jgi:hypothetical protein